MYFPNEILIDISQNINSVKAFNISYVFLEKTRLYYLSEKEKKKVLLVFRTVYLGFFPVRSIIGSKKMSIKNN